MLDPAEGSVPGDRVSFQNYDQKEPEKEINPKKKIWEKLQVGGGHNT